MDYRESYLFLGCCFFFLPLLTYSRLRNKEAHCTFCVSIFGRQQHGWRDPEAPVFKDRCPLWWITTSTFKNRKARRRSANLARRGPSPLIPVQQCKSSAQSRGHRRQCCQLSDFVATFREYSSFREAVNLGNFPAAL